MTKITIEVDYELVMTATNIAVSKDSNLPKEDVAELLRLREKLSEAMDTVYPKVAWKEFRAGYRDLEWVKDFQRGYTSEQDFDGLEIDMMGNVRFAAGVYPDVEMPKTDWYYGDPELAPQDQNPDELYPTGRMKFEYGGKTWFFILRKHGLTFFPVIWIVDESFWDTCPVRLFEAEL